MKGAESPQRAMVRQFGDVLRRTERATAAELAGYQAPLLSRLLRHAAETVPFYRDRISPVFADGGSIDLSRWRELPILSRGDAIAAGDVLRSARVPPELGPTKVETSSGSTGMPFRHVHDRLARIGAEAHTERGFRWWRMDTSRTFGAILHAEKAAPPDGRTAKGWSTRHPDAPMFTLSVNATIDQQIAWLERRRPAYLITYPSNLRELASAFLKSGTPPRFDLVLSLGGVVDEALRALCQSTFGARILDTYGMQEIGHIAGGCPTCGGYHVSAESVLVEILNADGEPAAPGETGDIVVTPLYAYSMPLIRYRTGDLAMTGPSRADCGIRLPTLTRILGRYRNAFRYPDGSRSWPMLPLGELWAVLPALQYQCVQLSPTEVEFRYVRDPRRPDLDLAALAALVRSHLHLGLTTKAIEVDAIRRSASGKYEDYVSLVEPSDAGRS